MNGGMIEGFDVCTRDRNVLPMYTFIDARNAPRGRPTLSRRLRRPS